MKNYLLTSQVAKLLDKSKVTLIRWIHQGKFDSVRKVGDELRVPIVSFNRFLESTKTGDQPPTTSDQVSSFSGDQEPE